MLRASIALTLLLGIYGSSITGGGSSTGPAATPQVYCRVGETPILLDAGGSSCVPVPVPAPTVCALGSQPVGYDGGSYCTAIAPALNIPPAPSALTDGKVLTVASGGMSSPTLYTFSSGGATGVGDLASGDLDGDGNIDVLRCSNSHVSILYGNGAGGFGSEQSLVSGGGDNYMGCDVGDFYHSGRLSIAVIGDDNKLRIYRNDGGKVFTAVLYTALVSGGPLRVADFNGDGWLDIVHRDTFEDVNGFKVYLNNGAGLFPTSARTATTGGGYLKDIAVLDFTGDGKPDIAGLGADGYVYIQPNNGSGGFSRVSPVALSGFGALATLGCMTTADFNRDGKPDLAMINYGNDSTTLMHILLNSGTGFANAGINYHVASTGVSGFAAGDFTGSGLPSIAYVSSFNPVVGILPGNGDGTFGAPTTYGVSSLGGKIVSGLFNADSRLDLAVGANTGIGVLLQGAPTYTSVAMTPVCLAGQQPVSPDGGATYCAATGAVAVTGPTNGQSLTYNGDAGAWALAPAVRYFTAMPGADAGGYPGEMVVHPAPIAGGQLGWVCVTPDAGTACDWHAIDVP